MICYAFPLAHEASDLLKFCTQKERFSIDGLECTMANYGTRPVLIALIGMGQERASQNTQTIFQYFRPRAFVLSGYGGALVSQLELGHIVVSTNFSSEEVVPFLRLLSGFDFGTFCTADEVVGTREKRDWYARSTHKQVVEMETAGVADIVHERGIPFMALRVISDDYQQVLPSGAMAAGFDPVKGRATPFRLLSYLMMHPRDIAPFRKFIPGLLVARKKLTTFLHQLNDELPPGW